MVGIPLLLVTGEDSKLISDWNQNGTAVQGKNIFWEVFVWTMSSRKLSSKVVAMLGN